MSTKAIKKALALLRDGNRAEHARWQEAMMEVEAIERAAKLLDGIAIRDTWHGEVWFAHGNDMDDLDAAADVLSAIAKDAP